MDVSSKSYGIDFNYQDPEPNFDRRKVHGVAATLIKVKDLRFSTALDQAGGGKVRNTVLKITLRPVCVYLGISVKASNGFSPRHGQKL